MLFNLHLHSLVLSRVLSLLQGVEIHLSYWAAHQDVASLPKPYRLWQWARWKWQGGSSQAAAARTGGKLNPYRNWSKMAARHVRELLELKKRWTARCGRICIRMHRIQDWLAASFSKTAVPPHAASSFSSSPQQPPTTAAAASLFHAQISTNQHYFAQLYGYVTCEELPMSVSHNDAPLSPHSTLPEAAAAVGANSIEGKILSLHSMLASFDACVTHLESRFTPAFEAEIEKRRKPGHLWRWWHVYAGGALALGVSTALAVKHRPKVVAALSDTWAALGE